MLKLFDINDYIEDTQQVKILAYGITLYEGDALHMPAGYCKYNLDPSQRRIYVDSNTQQIVITLDC